MRYDSLDTKQLALLLHGTETELASGLGNKDFVTGKVTSSGVVTTVRDSPRVVRDKEGRVDDPTDGVVDGLGRRVGLMTALVTENELKFHFLSIAKLTQ